MAHLVAQIVDAAVAELTGLVTTGDKVFDDRFGTLQPEDLPALRVYEGAESVEAIDVHANPLLERTMDLIVECVAKATARDVYDLVRSMRAEVEVAIAADDTFGNLAQSCLLVAYEPDVDLESELPIMVGRMTFRVRYFTRAQDPTVVA